MNNPLIINYLDKTNFCAMPFLHVAVESNGDIKPCCLGDPLVNEDGTNLNITGKSIAEILDHPTHIKFRQSFINNEQYPGCRACWGKFQNDRYSGRYVYSNHGYIASYVEECLQNNTLPDQRLMWLEIKAGNRCNLACRICGLWNSSKWLKETYEYNKLKKPDYPIFKESEELKLNRQAKWIDEVDFWRNIDKFEDLTLIHLMGGEPMMIDEHFEMLEAIANKFDASNIAIWYNTNATILPSKGAEDILNRFKIIHWSLSIDDFGDKFDYQRKGAIWKEVKDNIAYFYSKDTYKTNIDATISIFNIVTLDEFILELQSLPVKIRFDPHFVEGDWKSVRALHKDIKEYITRHLESSKSKMNIMFQKVIDNVLQYMNSVDTWDTKTDERRISEISFIDNQRNESFKNVFPKMAELLNYGQ